MQQKVIWYGGSQYDQIIHFIGKSAEVAHTDKVATTQNKTGYNGDQDILKNIYDLEGNYWEWTAQAAGSGRAERGSHYFLASNGRYHPASYQGDGWVDTEVGTVTARPVLYIVL